MYGGGYEKDPWIFAFDWIVAVCAFLLGVRARTFFLLAILMPLAAIVFKQVEQIKNLVQDHVMLEKG